MKSLFCVISSKELIYKRVPRKVLKWALMKKEGTKFYINLIEMYRDVERMYNGLNTSTKVYVEQM